MTRRWRLLLALFAGFSLVVAACGDDDDSGGGDGTEAPSDTTEATDGATEDGSAETTTTEATEELTASDVGVTESEIHIGVIVADLDGLREAGLSLPEPLTTDHLYSRTADYFDAWNAEGGINGRQIVAEQLTYDPVDPATADEMCAQATLDTELFAVFSQGGVRTPALQCFIDAGVLVFYGEAQPQSLYDSELLITVAPPIETLAAAGTQAAIDGGRLPTDSPIGILTGNEPSTAAGGDAAQALLEEAGFDVVRVDVNNAQGDPGAINQESGAAVGTFQAEGVKHVIVMLPFTQVGGFWTEAGKAGGFEFTMMDVASSSCTAFGASRTPAEAGTAECLTPWSNYIDPAGGLRDEFPGEADCRAFWDERYTDYYGGPSAPGIPSGQTIETPDGETLNSDYAQQECTMSAVIKYGLENGGVNPTRASVYEAALNMGEVQVILGSNGVGHLEPGKPFVADFIHAVRFNPVPEGTARGADGTFNGCPAPVNCFVPVDDVWSPIDLG